MTTGPQVLTLSLDAYDEADAEHAFYELMLVAERLEQQGVPDASIAVALFEAARHYLDAPEIH